MGGNPKAETRDPKANGDVKRELKAKGVGAAATAAAGRWGQKDEGRIGDW